MNFIIPTSLRQHTDGSKTVAVSGKTVDAALQDLINQYPNLRDQLINPSGQLVSFVNVFVNDSNIRDLNNGDTPLREIDEILLVPAIAGG